MRLFYTLFLIAPLIFLASCYSEPKQALRVGFNTWPGYEFIYLAKVRGFYESLGVDVKLVELNSLGDVRRAFERGQIDIMASTMVELVVVTENTRKQLKIIAVTDASNGADMLLAAKGTFDSISELKNKRIGMEGGTVDILVVNAALQTVGLTLNDVTFVGAAQDDLVREVALGRIDAVQTYPPYATGLLATGKYEKLFDTSQIPGQILDILSIHESVLKEREADVNKFLAAFFQAAEYFENHKLASAVIMGKREGLSAEEFIAAVSEIKMIGASEQDAYIKEGLGIEPLQSAIDALKQTGYIQEIYSAQDFFVKP